MTATAAVAPSGSLLDSRREALDLVATGALATYSFIAALGFARVFADWQFVADVAVVVVVGHGLSLLLRRLHVPGLAAVLLTALGLVWAVAWVSYPDTFAAIFPTRETWDIAWADLGLVRDQFQDAVAPVEYVGGWSLLASIGTGSGSPGRSSPPASSPPRCCARGSPSRRARRSAGAATRSR